jgi:hypothetical protein
MKTRTSGIKAGTALNLKHEGSFYIEEFTRIIIARWFKTNVYYQGDRNG